MRQGISASSRGGRVSRSLPRLRSLSRLRRPGTGAGRAALVSDDEGDEDELETPARRRREPARATLGKGALEATRESTDEAEDGGSKKGRRRSAERGGRSRRRGRRGEEADAASRAEAPELEDREDDVEDEDGESRRRSRRRGAKSRGGSSRGRRGSSERAGARRGPGRDDADWDDSTDDDDDLDDVSPSARRGRVLREASRQDIAARATARAKAVRRIYVNATDQEEIRIGLCSDGKLEELYYERPAEKKYLGNIYKGRIVNIEPAIQAAFVDLGIGRNGFLHVSDVLPVYKDADAVPVDRLSERGGPRRRFLIQDVLRKGQEVLVQISKDSIGMKGPSLTTYVSIPGKYLVLMPGVSRHGVSKRIQDYDERSNLRKKLAGLDPPEGVGYIVRTAGQDETDDVLQRDFKYLMDIWDEVRQGVRTRKAPQLLFQECDLVTRSLRDLFGSDVQEILIDEAEVYEHAKRFLLDIMPQAAQRLKHYDGTTPLFTKFGIESQIESIYNRRIPLPSGGWIIIEQTEALVAIDVNSGKYRDEEDLEATALKTNLEAAQEIVRQLRLRDLGGVIINDFIDMENSANRRELERSLKAALRHDKAKSWISRVSRFGIIEMTRQRVRPSFESSNHEPCSACSGSGWVKAPRSIGVGLLRRLAGELPKKRRRICEVFVAPAVSEYLLNTRRRALVEMEEALQKEIQIRVDSGLAPEEYSIKYR